MSIELGAMGTDGKFGANAGRAARSTIDSEDEGGFGVMKRDSTGTMGGFDRKDVDLAMEPSAEDVKKTLGGGTQFTKHAHGKSLSDKRIVWYHEVSGRGLLCWQPVATQHNYDPKRSVSLASIKAIYLGKQSPAFTRRHATNVNDDCAFSIETDRRTLDLEADNRRARDAWLKNLKVLLNAADVNYKVHASPNARDDEKEIMEKRGTPVKFQVHVRCKNLPRRLDAAELDSICLGFEKLEQTGRLVYLAQSDQIKENDSPAYGSPLVLPYYAGAKQMLKIAVYAVDGDQLAEDQQIGYAQLPFSTLVDGPGLGEEMSFFLKSNDPIKDKKLKDNKSQMFLTCTPALLSEAELLAKMQRIFMAGDSFYLYHSKHPASRVLVFFRKATHDKPDMLYWCRDNTVDKNGNATKEKARCVEFVDCCMPLLSITDIYLGRQTAAFDRPPANKAPSDRCFSFRSSFQGRVLDLQAKTPQIRDAWVFGLMALIRQTQNAARLSDRKIKSPDRLQLHNEPPPPRKTPIPHSHNFKVTLAVQCRNLPEAVDPLVGVFLRNGAGKLKFVDHTETIMDKSNPAYNKRLVVDYGDAQGAANDVRLTVYNVETPQIREKDTLGFASVSITQLLDSAGREIILPLNNPRNKSLNRTLSEKKAVVVVRNLQAFPTGTIELKCACRGLISLDGNSMGSKSWVLVAYESVGAGANGAETKGDEKDSKSPTSRPGATAAKSAKSIAVKYSGQTECLRDSSAGAADFKRSLGPFEYRGGDGKVVKLAVYVTKDETTAAGISAFTEKQQETERIGTAFINLDNLLISGEPSVTVHFLNSENRGREMRLKHEDAHVMISYAFRPSAAPAAAGAAGLAPVVLSADAKEAPAFRAGGTVSAAALNAALAGQGNAVGTVSIPAIIKKLQAKMTAGRSFIQYVAGQAPAKINLFYREDAKGAGALYWNPAGNGTTANVPNAANSIPLEQIAHVYHGKQFPALAPAPAAADTLFSIVTSTTQLHLQCNSSRTRDQWVYGIMGVLQAFGSSAKLHADVGAAPVSNGVANGTLSAPKKNGTMGTAKSALAASKGTEIAEALALPTLPATTQRMLAVMYQGKKFIRYPYGLSGSASINKVIYRAAGARLGTIYYTDANASDSPDLNALDASGAGMQVHTITNITVGAPADATPGPSVQTANLVSFTSSTGATLQLEAKDTKQASAWAKAVQSLLVTGGVNPVFSEAGAVGAAAPVPAVSVALASPIVLSPITTNGTPVAASSWTPPPPPSN